MRILRFILLAIALLVPVAAQPANAAPEAPNHPRNSSTLAICAWWDAYYFGPEWNGVYVNAYNEVHWWNHHQVVCVYYPIKWTLLYDRGSGARAWIH